MHYGYQTKDLPRRYQGLLIVGALHVLLGWALVSGTARKALESLKKPLEAVLIQEVIVPPPPVEPPLKQIKLPKPQVTKIVEMPPPFVPPPDIAPPVGTAPMIQSISVPPTIAPAISPIVVPPVQAAPVAPARPSRADIGLVCPTQVAPQMPRRALRDGTEGVVKAQILVKDGVVKEVSILSGPTVFHHAVRVAMLDYKCVHSGGEVVATQEFNFKIE
jgi:protein TonB